MCRVNQLWCYICIAFGVGLLVGLWLEGGFFAHCFGIGMILLGPCLMRKN